MKLTNAARYFDTETAKDAYTGAILFKAQLSTFDGASADGSFQRRRTVSVAPEVVLPARSVIESQGSQWILGEMLVDGFKNSAIRKTCSAKKATGLCSILTPGDAAKRVYGAALLAYGSIDYFKDAVLPGSSELLPVYDLTFAGVEVIPAGSFIVLGEYLYIVKVTRKLVDGFWSISCSQIALTDCQVTIYLQGDIDPVTEIPSAGRWAYGLLMDMSILYDYKNAAEAKNVSGDMSLVVQGSEEVSAGTIITVNEQSWLVKGFSDYHDAKVLHICRD